MADVALRSQPMKIGGRQSQTYRGPMISPAVRSLQHQGHLPDTHSPVTQDGSFEFDRIIKSGEVLKRTKKTKSWKTVHLVLRPNLLSIYKDKDESKLRHQINLSEITAVARQKDPRRKEKHVFGLFTPSRNYHLEAGSDSDAHEWVELIRREARFDQVEEELSLVSPGGANTVYRGFERSIDANLALAADDRAAAGYSSSDADAVLPPPPPISHSQALPRHRDRGRSNLSARRPSAVEYSGPEHGSYSDFSDSGIANATARMSALSLPATEGRPSTSRDAHAPPFHPASAAMYAQAPPRPSMGVRNPSQVSGLALDVEEAKTATAEEARVVFQSWIYLLKSKSGVRQWKKVWMVLRPRSLAIYKNEEEYTPLLVLPFSNIIDAVEIDPVSKSKTSCLQIISEERNFRLCAFDEESLTRWLGAFKSLLSKRKAKAAGTS